MEKPSGVPERRVGPIDLRSARCVDMFRDMFLRRMVLCGHERYEKHWVLHIAGVYLLYGVWHNDKRHVFHFV